MHTRTIKYRVLFACTMAIFTGTLVPAACIAWTVGTGPEFWPAWFRTFPLAYLAVIPVIIFIGPRVQAVVYRLTHPHPRSSSMHFLHTMVRVSDLHASLQFYREALGLQEVRRSVHETGRFTLVYLAAPGDKDAAAHQRPLLELTYNWDPETYTGGRNFGHIAYEVENIYAFCQALMDKGIPINRPPRDGHMAFIKSPDGISVELLQRGAALPPAEPWQSMQNTGSW